MRSRASVEDLQRVEFRIDTASARQQFLVSADLRDAAALEHDDGVRPAYGREPMGDDKRGAVPHQGV